MSKISLIFCCFLFSVVHAQNLSTDERNALNSFFKIAEQARSDELFTREYLLRDIDSDGTFEIVEISNQVETSYPGLLDIELFQIFEDHLIYYFDKESKSYRSDSDRFGFYYKSRKVYHELWLNEILDPTTLKKEHKEIIQVNKDYFAKEIKRLIKKTSNLVPN